MTTELISRINRIRLLRRLSFDGTNHTFCPIWFSDWSPFGGFTWQGTDENGNTYDLTIDYTQDTVTVLSSTPALPSYDINLYFRPPALFIIHSSELKTFVQQISLPTLVALADTGVSTALDGWIEHAVQLYYLIPIQSNLTAEEKIRIHRRQLQHFKDLMTKAMIFISRLSHTPYFIEDAERTVDGDFFTLSTTVDFREFKL